MQVTYCDITAESGNSEARIDVKLLGKCSLTHGSLGNAFVATELTHVYSARNNVNC
jgi:hypothetical protein